MDAQQPATFGVKPDEESIAWGREKIYQIRESAKHRQSWRRDAARAHEYFDGNQFDAELSEKFRQRELNKIVVNGVKRWVSSILGSSEQQLSDWTVRCDSLDGEYDDLAEALSYEMKYAESLTHADRSCLNALGNMVKGGIGWVEVGRSDDPFRETPYLVETLPWREMFWDGSAIQPSLRDAEWFRRVKYYKRSMVEQAFPDSKDIIRLSGTEHDYVAWNDAEQYERNDYGQRDSSIWVGAQADPSLDLICVNEIRYRVTINGYVVYTPGGARAFDEHNEAHLRAYNEGLVEPRPANYKRWRQAFWIGPHRLLDRWHSPAGGECGWVPFVCFMEDRTATVYGYVRDMIPMQDEANVRRAKAEWGMDNATIIADHDSVLDWDDARRAVNVRNGIIALDGSKPSSRFNIDRNRESTQSDIEMYRDAMQNMGYIHGLDAPFVGTPTSKDQSGVAMNTMIAQSHISLGAPRANFLEARRRVGELLLDEIIADMDQPRRLSYTTKGGKKSSLNINQPDEDGNKLDPRIVKRHVIVDDVPSTASYRQQQYNQLVNTVRSMSPEMQSLFAPLLIELSDLPNRQEYADMAKKVLGQDQPETDEEKAAADQAQQQKQALDELNMRALAAKIAIDEATAKKMMADMEKIGAQTEKTQTDEQKVLMEIKEMVMRMQQPAQPAEAAYSW